MQLLTDPSYQPEIMCVCFQFFVEYALVIYPVDSYPSAGVNDMRIAQQYAGMGDPSFSIVKECEVALYCFLE